jgi:GTP cyclohydrolase I
MSKIEVTQKEIDAVKLLLQSIGQDPNREGLIDTPKRYVRFLKEFCTPDDYNMTTFENDGSKDEMIIVSNIPFFSICEHHLAPFFGIAAIGYVPNDKIVGLSKIPRTLDKFSRQPQNQERITNDVAQYLMKQLQPKGVGVIIKARHLCVEMRGVKKHDCYTTTSSLQGCFKEQSCRQEFLNLIK